MTEGQDGVLLQLLFVLETSQQLKCFFLVRLKEKQVGESDDKQRHEEGPPETDDDPHEAAEMCGRVEVTIAH